MSEKYSCCFCGKEVRQESSVVLEVYAFSEPEERICLFAHKECYKTSLIKEVPLLPALLDDE
jgi:hypothetical protein